MTKRDFLIACLLVAGLLASVGRISEAGSLRLPSTPQDNRCSVVFEGPFDKGDAKLIAEGIPEWSEWGEYTLCLNSPGGFLEEGIIVAETLSERGIATLVRKGDACTSACAVAFLGGTCIATGDTGQHSSHCRYMEAGAIVGFHAPFLQVLEEANTKTFTPNDVRQVWALSRAVTGRYTEALAARDVPLDMVLDFLAVGVDNFSLIETIGEARRMGVKVLDLHGVKDLAKVEFLPEVILETCSELIDHKESLKQLRENDEFLKIQYLERNGRRVAIVSQVKFINVPWITYNICRVEYSSYDGRLYTDFAERPRNEINVEFCPNVSLRAPDSGDIPSPVHEWDGAYGPPKIQGDLRSDPHCESTKWLRGVETDMWVRKAETPLTIVSKPQAAIGIKSRPIVPALTPEVTITRKASTEVDEARLGLTRKERRELQRRLTLLGFDTQGVDGTFGPNSRSAIQAWQQSRSYVQTGFLGSAQYEALLAETQESFELWLAEENKRPKPKLVRVCKRGTLGVLVNCRNEWR